jgi:hypothetical protein
MATGILDKAKEMINPELLVKQAAEAYVPSPVVVRNDRPNSSNYEITTLSSSSFFPK